MLSRLSKKSKTPSGASQLKVYPHSPKHYNGNFKNLKPVNPGRQRITTENTLSGGTSNSADLDPYANIIIKGDPEKLYGNSVHSSIKYSESSNLAENVQLRVLNKHSRIFSTTVSKDEQLANGD